MRKSSLPVFEQEEEQTGAQLVEDQDQGSAGSEEEDEDEAGLQLRPTRKPAWVDEDDELEEE